MKYLKLVGSHRLASLLLGALGLAALLGGTLPQSARLSPEERQGWETEWSAASSWLDSLRLSDIFGSVWFTALVALLLANLAIGTGLCLHSRWRIWRNAAAPDSGDARRSVALLVRLSGVPLLHCGLLAVIAGGWWSAAEGFGAHLELTREEVYAGDPNKLVVARGSLDSFPARLRLDNAEIAVDEAGRIREMKAAVTYGIGSHSPRRAEVRANQPLKLDEYRIFPNNSFGYTAILDRLLPDGARRLMLVNFKAARSDWGNNWEFTRQKRLELPDSPPLFLRMTLSGPDTPRFSLQRTEGLDKQLRPGEEADLGPFRLRFRGIAPWMGFYLARDGGQDVVFAGILLTLAGFLLHLMLPYRCAAAERTRRVSVAGRLSACAAHAGEPRTGGVIRC